MRALSVLLGVSLIIIYSIVGAILLNDWAATTASGLPLDATIAEMNVANQPYSAVPGIAFAALGGVMALGWGFLTLSPQLMIPN